MRGLAERTVMTGVLLCVITACAHSPSAQRPAIVEPADAAEPVGTFTVRVRVGGLIATVPSTGGHALGFLLVDAPEPVRASNGCLIPWHDPRIEWHAGSCTQDGSDCSENGSGSDSIHYEDLQIRFVGDGPVVAFPPLDLGALADIEARPDEPFPKTGGGSTIGPEWMLHLGELYPEEGLVLNPGCLTPVPGMGCPVVGRLRVDYGTVRTCRLSEISHDGEEALRTWTFKFKTLDGQEVSEYAPRALGTVTEVVWQVQGTGLEIVKRPFDGFLDPAPYSLTPNAEGEIVLELLNVPPDELSPEPGCDARMVDYHFEHFYRVAEQSPALRYVPHAAEENPTDVQPACNLKSLTGHHTARKSPPTSGEDGREDIPGDLSACVRPIFPSHGGVEQLPAMELAGIQP